MGTEEILGAGNKVRKRKYKLHITPEEKSAAGKRAWATKLANGNANVGRKGGRPKGSKSKTHVGPSITFTIRAADHAVFARFANEGGMTMMDFMHTLAQGLCERNPKPIESEVKNDEQIRPEPPAVADNQ